MNRELIPLPNRENSTSKEFLSDNLAVALHARLLLGGPTLDPNKTDIPETTAEQLKSEHSKTREDTLNKISAASTVDRMEYWNKKGGTFDEQMKTWVTDIIKAVQKLLPRKRTRGKKLLSTKCSILGTDYRSKRPIINRIPNNCTIRHHIHLF